MALRDIIVIDEEKCNGCGQCILACAEGALELVDGKAKLVGDVYCDGLGACIGECPEGALTIIKKDTVEFSEEAVKELLGKKEKTKPAGPELKMACGCPSSQEEILCPADPSEPCGEPLSTLGHWPVKLRLVNPETPFLKGADLVLLADCAAAAYPGLHQKLLPKKVIVMGCPKFDDLDSYISRLTEILQTAKPRSLTTVYMEVPCCKGFVHAGETAIKNSGMDIPFKAMKISRTGKVMDS